MSSVQMRELDKPARCACIDNSKVRVSVQLPMRTTLWPLQAGSAQIMFCEQNNTAVKTVLQNTEGSLHEEQCESTSAEMAGCS